ncbi:hypothetical protein LCGC14_0664400 [marine sediment metagenome]|uniref:Uncharacterized protein n=1 Tax=marine sediment metagenome TaxID=412755 RepID=A0A0F9QXT8_9ZZZZ
MDKEVFEKKKSLLVRNGLGFANNLMDTFEALLKYDWYEKFVETINIDGKIIETESVDIKILFDKIRALTTELVKYPDKLESLWKKGLK